jgi:hypothetical protein
MPRTSCIAIFVFFASSAPAAAPEGNPDERGAWQTTHKLRPGEDLPYAAPAKTVRCDERPLAHLFRDGSCRAQIAERGGRCVREELRHEGSSKLKVVQVFTGDFHTAFEVKATFTRTYNFAPDKPQIQESTVELRYLGRCRPGMLQDRDYVVTEKGEWVLDTDFQEREKAEQLKKRR